MSESASDYSISPHLTRSRRLLWLIFGMAVTTLIVGRAWDSAWHTTHVFDGFFSPPHLFVYIMTIATIGLVELLLFNAHLRGEFGSGFRIRILPFAVPGSLALVGSGYALLALAGLVLDNLWHTQFGLDETMWSFPHALLGWAWLLIFLGLVSCCLQLYRQQSISEYTTLLIGVFLLGFSAAPVLGPFYQNTTPDMVQAIANIPILQVQPDAQRIYQIYLHWNLTRTNPLLIPLGAFWAGAALAFLRRFDARTPVWLAAVFFWTLITAMGDYQAAKRLDAIYPVLQPSAWLPLPILVVAVLFAVADLIHLPEKWAWITGGSGFGLCVIVFGGMQPLTLLLIPAAALMMRVGAAVGKRLYAMVMNPKREYVVQCITVTLAMPILTGVIDLYLRFATGY